MRHKIIITLKEGTIDKHVRMVYNFLETCDLVDDLEINPTSDGLMSVQAPIGAYIINPDKVKKLNDDQREFLFNILKT
jgi:hypothetical protein